MLKDLHPAAWRNDFAVAPFAPIRTAIRSIGTRGNGCRMVEGAADLFSKSCTALEQANSDANEQNDEQRGCE